MSRDVKATSPEQSIREAARTMARLGVAVLPVGDHNRLVGIITDRDIALRAVAEGKGPETRVAEVMSDDLTYCYEDNEIGDVLGGMAVLQLRRLLVLDRARRFVGTFAISDLAAVLHPTVMDSTLEGVSGPH
jgi:CBS domain-containing protein